MPPHHDGPEGIAPKGVEAGLNTSLNTLRH